MKVQKIVPVFILTTALLLSGCSEFLNFSPERAVMQSLMADNRAWGSIVPESVQILQKVEFGDGEWVLVSFQTVQDGIGGSECVSVYETIKLAGGWRTGSGGGGCTSGPGEEQPMFIGMGKSLSENSAESYAYGVVYEREIEAVAVLWDDGDEQRVPVINGSYLILREGDHMHQQVLAFTAGDELYYTYDAPDPAPGK